MIHPNTQLQWVDAEIGYGVFATAFIPKGTIVYVQDAMDLRFSPEAYEALPENLKETVEKYSFIDPNGIRVVSWDFAKYVNHCCQFNSISTGYGFEIAVRDIFPGEEITDEYSLFNLIEEMPLKCSKQGCRQVLRPTDNQEAAAKWDTLIQAALRDMRSLPQPLEPFMDGEIREKLAEYFVNPAAYVSVETLRMREPVTANSEI